MSLGLNFEYYPKINANLMEKLISISKSNKHHWDPPFFTDTETYIDMGAIHQASKGFLNEKIKNVIVLGTGGSIQTLLALRHLSKKNLYSITSSRAVELKRCLDATDPENSVVIPISRGGETLDVNSTIGIFLKNNYKFLGLSSKGTMRQILEKIGCPILEVPDVSGRFAGSISNVGIVPAFLLGVNIEDFLKGLTDAYKEFMGFDDNPAFRFAAFLYNLYEKGYKTVFSMPYSLNLEGSVGLFVQETSESTGKNEKGLLAAYQSAPLCQHSVLEYLLGGTKGAVVPVLWTIKNEFPDFNLDSSIEFVNGQTAQTIVNYQAGATFQALIEQGVPSAKVSIERCDEFNIGNLIAFIQSTVYYLCLLLNVNWSNNPKVVIGKKIGIEALKNRIPPEEREKTRKELAERKFNRDFFGIN